MDNNLSLQIDEVEALTSIYEDKLEVISEASRTYLFKINSDPYYKCNLQFRLPPRYPENEPPYYELHAPWLKADEKEHIHKSLDKLFDQSGGACILYEWIEFIKEYIDGKIPTEEEKETSQVVDTPIQISQVQIPTIIHGEPITDRRSTFQAHIAAVSQVSEVKVAREVLLSNRKISNATHNIVAYRIFNNGTLIQDCDDDGETAAGGRLLHLLQILNAKNVVVIVSRWYGGILLGPDRFKHINNAARTLLMEHGYVKQKS